MNVLKKNDKLCKREREGEKEEEKITQIKRK